MLNYRNRRFSTDFNVFLLQILDGTKNDINY